MYIFVIKKRMGKDNIILSPLTKGATRKILELDKNKLASRYKKEFGIDVSDIFRNVTSIWLYECVETGYRFFSPSNVAGDGFFYEQLEQIPWYYASWKWDYELAKNFIPFNALVLDIGCGEGFFLQYLKDNKNCDCFGLELNEKAKDIAVGNGLNVMNEFSEIHCIANEGKYDVVTFFQVLEHISEIDTFLKSAIKCTRVGGKIIIAVPNNNPYYLQYDKFHLLNLPPHHMGWWNSQSLNAIAERYNLTIETITTQSLQHFTSYTKSYLANKFPNSTLIQKLIYPLAKVYFFIKRKKIQGASIMAVYTRN